MVNLLTDTYRGSISSVLLASYRFYTEIDNIKAKRSADLVLIALDIIHPVKVVTE